MNLWHGKEKHPKIERFESFSADIYTNLANRGCKIDIEKRISVIAPESTTGSFIGIIYVFIGINPHISRTCGYDISLVQIDDFKRRRLIRL